MHHPFDDIRILRTQWLAGPSIWTYQPVLEALIDLGALEDCPSSTLPGFNQRLRSWLPALVEHRCSVGTRGGFFARLEEGTWAGHIVEHVALELQTQAGMPAGFGRTREAGPRGVYKLVIRSDHPSVAEAALRAGRDLVMAAINDRPFDVPAAIAALADLVDRHGLGPSTACIVAAAAERRIPAIRLNSGNLVQLGQGAAQRRIWTAETDQTSAIADEISRDKDLTKRLIEQVGVLVPEGGPADSAEAAWDVAQKIGVPVTVKPTDANHARGVSLNLRTQSQVHAAFAAAAKEGSGVLVERYIEGDEHRLLVVGDRVVAATRGELVCVRGDGHSTVRELIASQINTDPRRGTAESFPLEPLDADDPLRLLVLESQGLTPDSVVAAGHAPIVQRTGNMDIDVTADVHPDVAAQAVLAARTVGLDIAGIDLVAQDISQPLAAQRGAIVEVNAGPGLLMHLKPARGKVEPVGQAIAAHMFAPGETGRIPVVGIAGGTQAARLLASMLRLHGWYTGLACQDGLFLEGRQLHAGDATDFDSAQSLLINRRIQAAIIETTPRRILAEGLPYDRCQVGVVLSMPGPAGLDEWFITAADQMPTVLRTQVDVVLPAGAAVLNADAPEVLALARHCDGEVILVAHRETPEVAAHLAHGGRAVLGRDGAIILAAGAQRTTLVTLAATPSTGGQLPDSRTDVLAASAAAWFLGVAPRLIRAALLHLDEAAAVAA